MPMRHLVLCVSLIVAPAVLHGQGSVSTSVPLPELIKRAVADSNDPAVHYNLAMGYWGAKRWPEVDRELQSAILLDPRFAEPHLALAFLQIAANPKLWGSTDAAKKDSVQALVDKFDREYRHAFLINPMVDLRIMAAVTRSSDETMLRAAFGPLFVEYVGGIADCRSGKYPQCEDRLTEVIKELAGRDAPDDTYWHRGLAAAHQGHFAVAAGDFKLLLDRTTERVKQVEEKTIVNVPIRLNEYRYFEAVFRQMNGDTNQAYDLYHKVLENDLGMYIAHLRLAEIFEAKRDYAQAIDERRRAIDANPDDPSLQFDLGVTLGKSGRMDEAEATLRGASALMPRNIEVWFWLGLACEQTGKKADAKAAYEKVVALAASRFKARADQARARIAALQ